MGCMTETKPTVTVKHDLPDHLGVPRRPDGSLAQVTVTVEAETMALAGLALEKLHEDLQHYSTAWVRSVLTEKEQAELTVSTDDIPESVLDAVERIHEPFLTLPALVRFTEFSNDGLTDRDVHVTVTSPSVQIAMRSYLEMMEPQRLGLMLGGLGR